MNPIDVILLNLDIHSGKGQHVIEEMKDIWNVIIVGSNPALSIRLFKLGCSRLLCGADISTFDNFFFEYLCSASPMGLTL